MHACMSGHNRIFIVLMDCCSTSLLFDSCCLAVWCVGGFVSSLALSLLVMSLVNCHVVQRVFAKSFLTGLCLLCVGCVLPDCLDVG